MSVSDWRRLSQAPPANVNLYCSHCDSQIGIFDNEWIRLTSSYARARGQGTHFGTETGKKVKVVPQGQAQKAAEGCGMSEVFCMRCSSLVGQYCRTAPDAEKRPLVNQYFYKMSRTYLKDARTGENVDPTYGYGGDLSLPPPRPKPNLGLRMSVGATPRPSQTPLYMGRQPRDSLANFRESGFGRTNDSSFMYTESSQEDILDQSFEHPMSSQQPTFAEISSLKAAIESHGALIRQLQAEIRQLRAPSNDRPYAGLHRLDIVPTPEASSDSTTNDELSTLREENKTLKARFATIATAMGLVAEDIQGGNSVDNTISNASKSPSPVLGKRKRGEEQLPTPQSTNEPNSQQGVSFGGGLFSGVQAVAEQPFEGNVIMDDDATWDEPSNNHVSSVHPALSDTHLNGPTPRADEEVNGVVEFSDDEIAGLHFPTIQSVPAKLTIQQYKDLQGVRAVSSASSSNPIDLGNVQVFTPEDIRRRIAEEEMPKPRRVPADPKERIQSTAKYLDAELEELGLAEWIGKDKKSAEYRTAIQNARAARREAKKMEALARKGLKSTPMPQPKPKLKPPPTSVAPVKEAVPKASKAAASTESRKSTRNTEPLTEVTNQQQNKGSGSKVSSEGGKVDEKAAQPKGRCAVGAKTAQENESETGVMTRRQRREAQIQKRDQMVQEALEMEES